MKSAISVLGLATLVPAIQLVAIDKEASLLAPSVMMHPMQDSGEMTEAEIQQAVDSGEMTEADIQQAVADEQA
jgi:hypothetical protein